MQNCHYSSDFWMTIEIQNLVNFEAPDYVFPRCHWKSFHKIGFARFLSVYISVLPNLHTELSSLCPRGCTHENGCSHLFCEGWRR